MRSQTVREERFENALKIFENICVLKPFVRNGLRTVTSSTKKRRS